MKKFLTEESFSMLHVIAFILLSNLVNLGTSIVLDGVNRYNVINVKEVK